MENTQGSSASSNTSTLHDVPLDSQASNVSNAEIGVTKENEVLENLKLHKNMQLQLCFSSSNLKEIREFTEGIFKIVNGKAGDANDGDAAIAIPKDMLIRASENPFSELLQFVYPDLLSNMLKPSFFRWRAILAPTNESVEFVNDYLLSLMSGEEKIYYSCDRTCKEKSTPEVNEEIELIEFLNTIKCPGFPSHKLKLKVGVPVMLIKDIDPAGGLCIGTRLQIVNMGQFVLNCRILSGEHVGDMVIIPRIDLVPSGSSLPIKFKRRQFPVIVSFAMTINESQDQRLSHVGLYLPKPVLCHRQLYDVLLKVKSRSGIKIFIKPESGDKTIVTNPAAKTKVIRLVINDEVMDEL